MMIHAQTTSPAAVAITDLRCENRENPLGVDSAAPRLSWLLNLVRPTDRGGKQTAYRILAASSLEKIDKDEGDLWDTRRVNSANTIQIHYAGRVLSSFETIYWKVVVWDQNGHQSAWSKSAQWTAGLLKQIDWKAKWIAAPGSTQEASPFNPAKAGTLLIRRNLTVKPGLKRAIAIVCGLGEYNLFVNGVRTGNIVVTPGWTNYRKTCLYDTYDVTSSLHPGENAIGLFVGNGMYNVVSLRYHKFSGSFGPLMAIGSVRLEYKDGTTDTVDTDSSWRVAPGAITFDSVYGGEDYDARLESEGWSKSNFKDSEWFPGVVVAGPGGDLRGTSCSAPPVEAFQTLIPIHSQIIRDGLTVYDLGQNAPIMARFTVSGSAGSIVRITPAELVHTDGTVDRSSVGRGDAYWQYTLRGDALETYQSHFYTHGCRYLEVECAGPHDQQRPEIKSIEGLVVHAASPPVGEFSCSNQLFNRIDQLVRWAQIGNMMSVMTDCPHRERLGWIEQLHLNGPALRYNFDMQGLSTKASHDMADSQLSDGLIPDTAPEYTIFGGGFRDSPEWGSSVILVPWQQYTFDGDIDLLKNHYDGMMRYIQYLTSRAQNHIINYGLGDWYDIGPKPPGDSQLTPAALTATSVYYQDIIALRQIATLLGHVQDAESLDQLGRSVKTAFNSKFYNSETHSYATGSQCSNAMPYVVGLTDESNNPQILANIVDDIGRHDGMNTAGDVGYRYVLRALANGGRSDLVYEMNNQSDKPGYGYQLAQGATSLTEAWDAFRGSSQNHFMLGQINEWLYHDLAGIQPGFDHPGFENITIKPAIVGDLTWVKADYLSVHGLISSHWSRDSNNLNLELTIPANTTATVYIPATATENIVEGTKPLGQVPELYVLQRDSFHTIVRVSSGHYIFHVRHAGN